jgi:hypothetical protein
MGPNREPTMGTNRSCHESDLPVPAPRVAIGAGMLTAMSGRAEVGRRQQATPGGSFTVARTVLRFAAVFFTLAPGLTMTSFGCVLPLAPSFDDPPAERNYAPTLTTFAPPQGFVSPGALSVTVSDPNVGDDLVVRWILEYPPFSDRTHRLKDDHFTHSADGKELQQPSEAPDLGCLSLAQGISAHPITALVADRAFLVRPDLPLEEQLTALPTGALTVEAHWVLNVTCGP